MGRVRKVGGDKAIDASKVLESHKALNMSLNLSNEAEQHRKILPSTPPPKAQHWMVSSSPSAHSLEHKHDTKSVGNQLIWIPHQPPLSNDQRIAAQVNMDRLMAERARRTNPQKVPPAVELDHHFKATVKMLKESNLDVVETLKKWIKLQQYPSEYIPLPNIKENQYRVHMALYLASQGFDVLHTFEQWLRSAVRMSEILKTIDPSLTSNAEASSSGSTHVTVADLGKASSGQVSSHQPMVQGSSTTPKGCHTNFD